MEKINTANILQNVRKMLLYQPPSMPNVFLLNGKNESEVERSTVSSHLAESTRQLNELVRYAHSLTNLIEKTVAVLRQGEFTAEKSLINEKLSNLEQEWKLLSPILLTYYNTDAAMEKRPISAILEENKTILNFLYNLPLNKDIVVRNLSIPSEPPVKAMLVFMDGLIDKKIINLNILQPLMLQENFQSIFNGDNLARMLIEQYLPSGQATNINNFQDVQVAVNSGDSVLFFDGFAEAISIETKGFEHRGIERPTTEQSVRGAQNAFTEVLRVNTALIRTMLHSSDLITEMLSVGRRGHLNCAVMYLKSVANPKLIAEVKRRIESINVDFINDSGILEQFIVDSPRNPFPQTLSTERPDRVTAHLLEGRIGILLEGSPFGQVVPISFFTLMHSTDDFSLNIYYSNMLRIIRYIGAVLSLLLPALYLAISTFHQEAIPTELLLSIIAARSQVPFPTIIEILLMEFSFELVREGGLRIPGILGSTIGIVGALILGQAAVSAKIVSPIMVIIIALTGLSSYTIPEYRLASALRLLRFVFIFLALAMGLVGIACGFMILVAILCSMKSFGVPYMAPVAPKTSSSGDIVLRTPVYKQKFRPDELNPQDTNRQPDNPRGWIGRTPSGGEHS